MNRYPTEPTEDIEPSALADPNLEEPTEEFVPAWGEAPSAPAGEPASTAAAAALPDSTELARQNKLLRDRLAQEATARQQAAAQSVQQWLASLPEDQRERNRRLIEDGLRETEDKRRVMWTIAQKSELQGQHLQGFYEEAQGAADPYTMERMGARYKRLQELETAGGAAAKKEKPAMARTRPDAGAPQGNQAGSGRKRREEILAPFMPGGAKQGKLEEMDLELQRHGYYG